MSLAVGEVFAEYEIMRKLGAGTLGTVYAAQHPQVARTDALKVLSTEATADAHYRARFLNEAEVTASLSHPNILGLHDHGEYQGQFWLSMDHVQGSTAASQLQGRCRNGMLIDEALQIVSAAASALDYAHRRGLLHRNVKPANILLAEPRPGDRQILLADFGVGRRNTVVQETTNIPIDKVAYAAPEQLMGEPVYPAADQYALACTAFHLLTGTLPFNSPNTTAVINSHVAARPPSAGARRPELAAMDPVFAKAMTKIPTYRFPNCQEFARELCSRVPSR